MRRLGLLAGAVVAAGLTSLALPQTAASRSPCLHPSITVRKAAGEVELRCEEETRARYPATFGPNPVGAKEREGDGRTPEGSYRVISRVKTPRFHRFLGISYPNDQDKQRAREKGVTSPGRGIGIHGSSDRLAHLARIFTRVVHATRLSKVVGVTDGCIALMNEDIEALFDAVPVGTPVTIEP